MDVFAIRSGQRIRLGTAPGGETTRFTLSPGVIVGGGAVFFEAVPSRRVGEFVMAELRKLDHVAFVRFASVYRAFEDVADFREELDRLERDLPGEGQLPLLGADVVPFDKHAEKGKKR